MDLLLALLEAAWELLLIFTVWHYWTQVDLSDLQ